GLFVLEGNDDDGVAIDAYVLTRNFALADDTKENVLGNMFRLRKIWIGGEVSKSLSLSVFSDGDDARHYIVRPTYLDQRQHGMEVTIGRDGVGRYFAIKIANLDGADFSLDRIDAQPIVLNRRPRRA
ncbi:MAG: hypothetical protein RQ750_17740, partial [Roseovarius sp.]|nr:hypothetical protein [Roseovarius sp.]